MTLQEIIDVCREHHNGFTARYRITYADGRKETRRLCLSDNTDKTITKVGMIGRRCRHYGHYITSWEAEHIQSVVPVTNRKNRAGRFIKRAKKAAEMLSKSGLWPDILQCLNHFLSLPQVEQESLINDIYEDSYELFYEQTFSNGKYSWVVSHQVFEAFANEKCWKSIAWSYNRQGHTEAVQEAITKKADYLHRWTHGYDNTIEVKSCSDGKMRGWYSEEYRGCGNGHYYLLFDATHAIFYEDD